ncbi:MAG: DUF998 domain-containing protein [Anaerolineales bacterium]|jgi:hypothetical protein
METPANGKQENLLMFRFFLVSVVVGPVFFIVMFLIEGVTRPEYSAFRQPVSSLSIGELGWTQIANFLITGAPYSHLRLDIGKWGVPQATRLGVAG